MAETMTLIDNRQHPGDGSSETLAPTPVEDKSPFRRIEFHLARKPFTGFSNGGGDGTFLLETLNPTTTSANKSNNQQRVGLANGYSGKKRDASEMENGLDPELSFGITFRRIGAGLENLGNTCFLNSVLQCLTYTEPLAAYLQSGKHRNSCRTIGFCALCAIQNHVRRALESSGRSLAPKDLVSNLRSISRTFRNSRQEDAHEYMVNLLESMHKCCLPSDVPSESPSAFERSLVHKIFGGRLRSQVKCMQCNYCSNKFDPFLDLSLEILKAETLYKAFANFTAKEQLDGGAKQYQCEQCKQKVKALKQLTIHKAPNVLTIHLKRFSHMSGQKIDKKIQFGPTLDLKPFVTGPYDGDLNYTLYGVLVHAGWSTHSGHYYCFVRTSSGMWYSLDDNRVFQVSEKKVFEQKAYMLFYFRDRKNFPLKKPTDVYQKEKMVVNSMGRNNTCPIIGEDTRRDTILGNGTPNGLNSTAAIATQRDALSTTAPKVSQMNTTLNNQTLDGPKASAAVDTEKDVSSTVAPKETQLIEASAQKCSSESHLENSRQVLSQNDTTNGSPYAVKCDDAAKLERDMKNDMSTVAAIPSSSSGPQDSNPVVNIKETSSIILPECKENRSGMPRNCFEQLGTPGHTVCIKEKTCVPLETPGDTAVVKEMILTEKIGELSHEVNGSESFGAGDVDDGQKGVFTKMSAVFTKMSAELSNLPKLDRYNTESADLQTLERSNREEAVLHQKRRKKMRVLKCKFITMKFSSKFLMGASVNQRKKKRRKRNRKGKLRSEDLTHENLMDVDYIPRHQGPTSSNKIDQQDKEAKPGSGEIPSSSDNVNPIDAIFAHTLVNGVKSGSKTRDKNSRTLVNPIGNEFEARVDTDGAVLATPLERNSNSTAAGSQSDLKGPNSSNDCMRTSKQELLQMLTRGLDDRIVPRWDEDESTPSQIRETTGVQTIGYVGDEWDEEYDRGKRKKVRSSNTDFDGNNPFQDIANERINLNAAKQKQQFKVTSTKRNKQFKRSLPRKNKQFKKSSSGNRPYRI